MKKTVGLISLLILMMGLVSCNGETFNIDFPFGVEDVENIEMYHYSGVPVSAEKKVIVEESDITALYDMFEDLSLEDKQVEETTGASVTSFRFNLSDGTNYELVYVCDGVKNGPRAILNTLQVQILALIGLILTLKQFQLKKANCRSSPTNSHLSGSLPST